MLNFLEEVIRIVLKRLERADIPAKYDAREIEGDDYEKWILLHNTSLSQHGAGQQPDPSRIESFQSNVQDARSAPRTVWSM